MNKHEIEMAREFCYTNEARRMFVRIIGGQVMPIGHSEAGVFQLMADFAAEQLATRETDLRNSLEGMVAAFDRDDYGDESIVQTTRECALQIAKETLGWTSHPDPPNDEAEG